MSWPAPILVGQQWAPRDCPSARAYERRHGGPMRLRVQSVSDSSPWARVLVRVCTGSVPTGRRRVLSATELRAGFDLLGAEDS
jgi:hypothetical protein